MIARLKAVLRPPRNLALFFAGLVYDGWRALRHGNWRRSATQSALRDYRAVKIYHRLEKSLSFRRRAPGAGQEAARELAQLLTATAAHAPGYQERAGVAALSAYLHVARQERVLRDDVLQGLEQALASHEPGLGERIPAGSKPCSREQLAQGRLSEPERFFASRASVRDFAATPVPQEQVLRVIELARHSPSVCNRQAWHVYHLDQRPLIDAALSYQNGNRGFGHEVPCLLIVCADLRAFDTPSERHQHWIDGGMFAMSLVWAAHALGLASCCLNWSKLITDDRKLRRRFAIEPAHTVMMMIALGYSKERIRVCASPRRPLSELYTHLTDARS